MDNTGIGESVRRQREALGMTQEDLARACMVSRVTISNWETGRTLPDIQSLTYLAEVFGVTVNDLVDQVASETHRRVSMDKRELLLLALAFAFIGVLYIPLEMMLKRDALPAPDIPAAAVNTIILIGIVAIVVRMGMILRKHNLSTDREIADYLSGSIQNASKKKGFVRRHQFELSILLCAMLCLVLMVVFGDGWNVAFFIALAASVVIEVVFNRISG